MRIVLNTPLSEMMRTERIIANSFHHQAIKKLEMGLIMALAEDGIIEAVYSSGRQYIRAYQWNPERLFEADTQNRIIFEDFIRACKS